MSAGPRIALTADATPVVAWTETDTSTGTFIETWVTKWSGSSWTGLADTDVGFDPISPGTKCSAEGIAVDSIGRIVVAVACINDGIHIERFDHGGWSQLGASFGTAGYASSLAIDSDDNPVIVWAQKTSDTNYEIYLVRWNGTAFEGLGGSDSGGGLSNTAESSTTPVVASSGDGHPFVAWVETHSNQEIYVRYWDGNAWSEFPSGSANSGGVSDDGGQSNTPSIAVTAMRVCVSWLATSGTGSVFLRCAKR